MYYQYQYLGVAHNTELQYSCYVSELDAFENYQKYTTCIFCASEIVRILFGLVQCVLCTFVVLLLKVQ